MKAYSQILLLFIFMSCLFISCSNDKDLPEENKTYTFHSIMWKLEEGDKQEVIEDHRSISIHNNVDELAIITNKSEDYIKDYSHFHNSEDAELLTQLMGEDYTVSIPSEISLLSSDYVYYSGKEAPLRIGEKVELEPSTKVKESTTLPPHSKLTTNVTIYQNKITATYRIRLVADDDSFDYKDIHGKWTGVFLRNMESSSVVEEIK